MFKKYNDSIQKKLLSSKNHITTSEATSSENWDQTLKEHLSMISIIQHERLIHLLVTIFVGISMLLCCLATIVTDKVFLIFLDLPLLTLFLAYVFHYFYLENTTQSWYLLTQEIKVLININEA